MYDFLSYLKSLDVILWRDGEKIRFSAPAGVLTPTLREEIRKHKDEMLTFLPDTAPLPKAAQSIVSVARNQPLPLSFAQQRLWFLSQLEPDNPVYNFVFAIRLTGLLNITHLEKSINALVARHEVLRTTFVTIQSQPVQHIAPSLSIPLHRVDLFNMPPAEKEAHIQASIDAEALSVFDLSKGPLLHATLLCVHAQEHILLLVVHHIIGDDWSAKILLSELPAFYEAFENGQALPFSPLPIQYADFAVWQREWLQGAVLEQQLAYWKGQLAGAPTLMALPIDHPRSNTQTHRGAHVQQHLPSSLFTTLKAFNRQEQSTLFMTLIAAFATLLARYGGQDDIIIGTPIANRTRSEVESLIGFFVNTLAIRVDLSGKPSASQLLKQVRTRALEAYAHQDVPFEQLVEHLQPERTLSHAPIVQVLLVLQEEERKVITFSNMQMEMMDAEIEVAKFDLTLVVRPDAGGLLCSWEYNTQLFERETIVSLGEHFQVLLEGMAHYPDQALCRLPLLTAREQEQVLGVWNATEVASPISGCLHELFEAQVELTPDSIALVFENEQLSYAELNRRSNQAAHYLRECGVGPDVLVALCVERSLFTIVGLLAILKAGGAFIPLAPSNPYQHQDFILQDSHAAVLLTQKSLVEHLPNYRCPIVCLDDHAQDLARRPDTNPHSGASTQHLAYAIYTSGSTGQPKGVLIPHYAIARHAALMVKKYQLQPNDHVLQFTALTFDISLEQIFPTLVAGARLVLRGSEVWSITDFHEKVHSYGLTVMNLAPVYWQQLVQEWADAPERVLNTHLRLVIVGGDKMLAHYVRLWQQTPLRSTQLLNAYGPAETTITSTSFEVPLLLGGEDSAENVPIGRPMPSRKMYILDANEQLVPIGLAGELYIGGDLLARGYLRRPELTAERFLPDPFSPDPLARMYKTGDLVRYLQDGSIEFLDRVDFQVKILGIRIELGEIEEALRTLPAVREVVVTAYEKSRSEKSLVAYIVAAAEQFPTTSSLRQALKAKIPDYMIPAAFVFLDAFPLSPNGKIDRQKLPAAQEEIEEISAAHEQALTMMEELVLSVWTNVLDRKQIGQQQNFFELGGHSLLVIQIISRLKAIIGVELHVKDIFTYPTVTQLAAFIEQTTRDGERSAAPAIELAKRQEDLPLSFAQQRLWFIEQLESGTLLYTLPLLLRLYGQLQVQTLERSLQLMLLRQQSLRSVFPSQHGIPRQVIVPQSNWQLPLIDLSALDASGRLAEERHKIQESISQPFDLEQGPLFRAVLLRLLPEEHILVCSMHHIVADGWSMEIVEREIALCYTALLTGEIPSFTPLPIQYADFAVWQREWLQGAVLEQQLAYWKERLAGAPTLMALPIDHPRAATQTHQGAHVLQQLPASLFTTLKAFSRQEQSTLFMSLLTAFAALLARYGGQDDIVIGTPIANRTRTEVESLIGFFVNTLAIRVDLSGDPSASQLLKQVRSRALEAYAHQDVPFEQLVEHLQLERTLSHAPIVQVLLVLQEEGKKAITFSNMRMEMMDVEIEVAKFDLTLVVRPDEGRLLCSWEYNTQLFERETIVKLGEHFQMLLEGMIHYPDRTIASVPLLTLSEQEQVLGLWNATDVEYPMPGCLHELFEMQVEQTPESIALVFENEQLSYAELNRQANQLAHYLRECGVGPEVLVGICMERSVALVIGLLGILKAGGAYVPLDPDYPLERLRFLIEDIHSSVVLTQDRLRTKLVSLPVQLLYLDSIQTQWSGHQPGNPEPLAQLENVAYVIYTSGSTGKPKGVVNTHRGINNRLLWMQDAYRLTPQDRVLQKTPFNFDVSVWEFFWPLLTGARLVMARPGIHRESRSLLESIREQQITTLHFVPSMLSIFLQEADVEQCQSIRQVICSGEALTGEQQKRFFQRLPAQLINLYGPTEAAVDVTSWICERDDEQDMVPIGRPIANIQIYVLDQHGQPVPVGVPGELHIGGIGVARGYLNRPDLTAEKFIAHPLSTRAGARLYKTGDLVCYQPDGAIKYLGRIDHQIKLRGQRIELGEIEFFLKQHTAVRDCVVLVREDQPGDKRLIAYVVLLTGAEMNVTGFHHFLQAQLPQYMIPSAFVQLETLPLNVNGKLDRAALPAPSQWSRDEKASEYVAPRTQVEETLVAIWSRVLDIDQISTHDNFFVLGGDSIRSIQVLSLMKERGLFCTLQEFFQHQTIHDLANTLQFTQTVSAARPRTAPFDLLTDADTASLLLRTDVEDAYPLTALQAGMIYHLLLTEDNPMYHNVISLHMRGTFHEDSLRQALQMLVVRHANLRTSFDLGTYSEPLQIVHQTAPLPLLVEDIRLLSADEQEHIITARVQQEKVHLFDIATPPLLRFHIFRRTEETFQLTITEYHPILDGWSYHLNLVEMFQYHDQLLQGQVLDVQPLQISFRDYVALEQQVLQSAEHRNYWMQKLANNTFLQVPRLQAPDHSAPVPLIRSHQIPITPQLSDEIWQLSRQIAFPLKNILLAAHIKLMSMLAGNSDVLTGLVSNGRLEELDGDKVRGLFLLTVPFRLNVSQGTWIDLIEDVFHTEQDLLPFRRYPLLAMQDDLGGQTLFETAFNYMHFHSVADLFYKTMEIIEPPKTLEETNFTLQTNVWLEPSSSRIYLSLWYDNNVISEEQVVYFGECYENILRSMVSNPHTYQQRQSFIPTGKMQDILFAWNNTDVVYPATYLVHEMFEAQAKRTPDTVAVVYKQKVLTYSELDRRANQLAHYLQQQGVQVGSLVGICLARSEEMLIGLLGILKTGAAYVPLDPSYPKERLAFMLTDAQISVLLTELSVSEGLPAHAARMIYLDRDWPAIAQEPIEGPGSGAVAGDLAYVIYTSGSTGKPKGVQVLHTSVVNLLVSMRDQLGTQEQDSLLALTTLSFDIAVLELFLPLIVGARVVLLDREVTTSGEQLAQQVAVSGATIMQATPVSWRLLLDAGWRGSSTLTMLCGGEALPFELAQRLIEKGASLWNLYGPTETTIWSATQRITAEQGGIRIGHPLANTQIYLLDAVLQPVLPGVPAEIYIGGSGVARGYLRRPDLTAERFIPHPFSKEPGRRLYKTGDLARYQSDGTIEYLSRTDTQVKLRGHRIELGEIEHALSEQPAIQECVVLLRDGVLADKQLVAYIVEREHQKLPSMSQLRQALQEYLPDYMIPTAVVLLKSLPLTPNGKVDRRALPAPERLHDELRGEQEEPRNPLEKTLVDIWSEVLEHAHVSIHDNFFALGGNSILSVQIVARATRLGISLDIKLVHKYQTIAELSAVLEGNLFSSGAAKNS